MASPHVIVIINSFALFLVMNGVIMSQQQHLVLEQGYTVTTLIDGNKMGFNPHSILPRFPSSDFVVLDSARSSFYTLSSPISQDSVFGRLAGNGSAGFADGDLGSVAFNGPKSFAIDLKGNVYVADKGNHVIRKITQSGVTTIAGGSSRKAGYADGPAQEALFSGDFDLTFVPGMCALLISDHGNKRVRQIDLKREDCHLASHSALGATYIWIFGLVISFILGIVGGFVARPYITSHEGSRSLSLMQTWNIHRINLVKQVVTFCFDIRNAIANSTAYALLRKFISLNLSYLSLILSFTIVKSKSAHVHPVSLMDSDVVSSSSEVKQLDKFASQSKELIMLDGSSEPLSAMACPTLDPEDLNEVTPSSATSFGNHGSLESLMDENLMDFVTKSPKPSTENLAPTTSTLARRRHALGISPQGS